MRTFFKSPKQSFMFFFTGKKFSRKKIWLKKNPHTTEAYFDVFFSSRDCKNIKIVQKTSSGKKHGTFPITKLRNALRNFVMGNVPSQSYATCKSKDKYISKGNYLILLSLKTKIFKINIIYLIKIIIKCIYLITQYSTKSSESSQKLCSNICISRDDAKFCPICFVIIYEPFT